MLACFQHLHADLPIHRCSRCHRPGRAPGQGGKACLGTVIVGLGQLHQTLTKHGDGGPVMNIGDLVTGYAQLL